MSQIVCFTGIRYITQSPTQVANQHQLSDEENIMSQLGSQNTQVVFWERKISVTKLH